jgi:hypothetical protein
MDWNSMLFDDSSNSIDVSQHFTLKQVCIGGKNQNRIYEKKRVCNYCSEQYAPKSNTLNLRNHLKSVHKIKAEVQSVLPKSNNELTKDEFYKLMAKHAAVLNIPDTALENVTIYKTQKYTLCR